MQYAVEFTGEISSQASADDVVAQLGEVLRLTPERTRAFLQGGARVVRRGLDREAADKYLAVLNRTGAVFRLQEEAAPATATTAPGSVTAAAESASPGAEPVPAAAARAAPAPAAEPPGVAPSHRSRKKKRKKQKSKTSHKSSRHGVLPYLRELGLPVLLLAALLALALGGRQFLKDMLPDDEEAAAKPVEATAMAAGDVPAAVAELAAMPSTGWRLSAGPMVQAAPPLSADEPRPAAAACAVAAAYMRSFEAYGCRVVDVPPPEALPARWEEQGSGSFLVSPALAAEHRGAKALDVLVLAHLPWDRRTQEVMDCPACQSFFSLYAWDRSGAEPRLVESEVAFALGGVQDQAPQIVERKLSSAHLVLEEKQGFTRQGLVGRSTSLHEVSSQGARVILADFVTACGKQADCEGESCWSFQGSITPLPAPSPEQLPALRLQQTGRTAKGPLHVDETVTPVGGAYRPRLTRQCETKG